MNGTAGTIWFRNGDGRQQAARCESVVLSEPALEPWAWLVSPMSTGPGSTCNLPVSLVNFQGSSCVGTASSQRATRLSQAPQLHGGRRSLIARLQPARYPRCRLAPPPFPLWVIRHSAPSPCTHALGYHLKRVSIENDGNRASEEPPAPFQTNPRVEKRPILSAWHTAHAALIANT